MRQVYQRRKEVRLELTPLIDIVFILLIFFAVSTSLITNNKGIPLDLPQAASSESNEVGVTVSINKEAEIFVDQEPVQLSNIQNHLKKAFAQKGSVEVIISADQSLPYRFVVSVLDAVRLSGGEKISLQAEKTIIVD